MKPHLDIAHKGTLGTEGRTRFSFDENSVAHLMSILTDLYSNPTMAVIREYSLNALDSHLAAGNPAPIRVTSPTSLNPVFEVEDEGVGMSVDDILHHFSKYGWSSKRDTDTQTGMLGLGCKSALTYTSQFTVVAIQHGLQATCLVTRESDGAGAVQIIDTCATDKPNGVRVTIPVKIPSQFATQIKQFFSFWDERLVLIDGEPPERIGFAKGDKWLDPDVLLTRSVEHDYIVMGQIAYPLGDRYTSIIRTGNQARVVAWVPMGSVDFIPSREALQKTKRTNDVIETLGTFVEQSLVRQASFDLEQPASWTAALELGVHWKQMFPNILLKRHGVTLPKHFVSDGDILHWSSNHVGYKSDKIHHITPEEALKALHIVGHGGRYLDKWTKERIIEYRNKNNLKTSIVFAYHSLINAGSWLDDVVKVTWEELRGTRTPVKRQVLPFKQIVSQGFVKEFKAPTGLVVYFEANAFKERESRSILYRHVNTLDSSIMLCAVNKASVARFKQENPTAVTLREWVEDGTTHFVGSLTDTELLNIQDRYLINKGGLKVLPPWQIQDPELAELCNLVYDTAVTHKWESWMRLCDHLRIARPKLPSSPLQGRIQHALKQYPLLETLDEWRIRNHQKELLEYINSLYLTRQLFKGN